MTVTTIEVFDRVCLEDRTESEPAVFLTCPHARGGRGERCFDLIRRGCAVFGVCTDHVSRWPSYDRGHILPGLREHSPELAAFLESPERAVPWPVPQIGADLFDRLGARATTHGSGATASLRYVCVPEETRQEPHLFEVGYLHATQHPVYDALPAGEGGYHHACPGCERRTGFIGSFDGHTLRVYCRCGSEREVWQDEDIRGSVIKGFREADEDFAWFRDGESRVRASVFQMRERGVREGWYPQAVTVQDEALLDQAMRTARASTVRGAQAARHVAQPWLRALEVAEAISNALTADHRLDDELRRFLRPHRAGGR